MPVLKEQQHRRVMKTSDVSRVDEW